MIQIDIAKVVEAIGTRAIGVIIVVGGLILFGLGKLESTFFLRIISIGVAAEIYALSQDKYLQKGNVSYLIFSIVGVLIVVIALFKPIISPAIYLLFELLPNGSIPIQSSHLNTIGLGLDIIGVFILLFKGLPVLITMTTEKGKDEKIIYVWELAEEDDQERMKQYYDRSKSFKIIFAISIVMIVVGFVLQILSNYI
ncbi:MAG: hypothetical protein KKE11_02250 [Gammaproteobacteria bacterium]|nr:hypothetical protein [Gammaproteobacteria bacterium]